MPVVVDGVKMDGRGIEKNGKRAGKDSRAAQRREGKSFLAFGKVRKQEESHRETREGERRPGKQRKELRPMRRPKRWRSHWHDYRRNNSSQHSADSRRRHAAIPRGPAQHTH